MLTRPPSRPDRRSTDDGALRKLRSEVDRLPPGRACVVHV